MSVVVNGFVANMDEWMIASDCIVTKVCIFPQRAKGNERGREANMDEWFTNSSQGIYSPPLTPEGPGGSSTTSQSLALCTLCASSGRGVPSTCAISSALHKYRQPVCTVSLCTVCGARRVCVRGRVCVYE